MSRKQPKRRAGNMVFKAMAGIFIFAIVCGVGFGVASADSSDGLVRAGSFGFDETTQQITAETARVSQGAGSATTESAAVYDRATLTTASLRTIDSGLKMIDEREAAERRRAEAEAKAERKRLEAEAKAERERIAAENVRVLDRVAATKEKQGVSSEPNASSDYGLPGVDWTVGYESFMEEWTNRIDSYLAGTPLEGCGWIFADAAWANGVDPRLSPAISNTESGSGSVCFLPYNAWGWGQSSWGDWESAIRAHVAGLAEGYGYCITPGMASVYCPPNSSFWYSNTFAQMESI